MITPMLHASLIARREDADALLRDLGALGLLHLQLEIASDAVLHEAEEDIRSLGEVLRILGTRPARAASASDPAALVARVRRLLHRRQRMQELDQHLRREEKIWAPFGDVETGTLMALRGGGLSVGFFRIRGTAQPTSSDEVLLLPAAGNHVVALWPEGKTPELAAEEITMPRRSLRTLRARRARLARLLATFEEELDQAAGSIEALRAYQTRLEQKRDLLRAREGMGRGDDLVWVRGFLPAMDRPRIEALARERGLALVTREPLDDDPVPTHLEHRGMVRWIRPVLDFLGVSPGYREVDVGGVFLVFLSLFSSMIIGDAGYGALLLIGLLAGRQRFPALRKPFANLLLLMGGGTVIWGLLTGNVFGLAVLPAPLAALRVDWLQSPENLMHLCFLLGAVHLSLAHGWTALRLRQRPQALAQLGWIAVTWTMYFTAGAMVLGRPFPSAMFPVAGLGVLAVFLFMTPVRKLRQEWVQHVMLPLNLVNNFVDVVSYVRLYAVGMATFALASSFNAMVLEGGGRSWLAGLVSMLILVLGHALNLVLAAMGVLVHGIRLNTLEFASHLGLVWSGIPYKPFRTVSEPLTQENPDHGP